MCVCKSHHQPNVVVSLRKRSCEENCTEDVMIYRSLFPAVDVCFLTACFFLPFLDLCQELRLTHFMLYRQNRTAPTGRGRSLVCRMMSVFGEDECVGGGG